ncbi:hypothetical protein [Mycolicibacterium nivoides]|uniref:Uncharacterized protein n=1 Tax=Mycolicibacterium nivoides TaxID=2487344 RepID=A0ABW9LGK9_9MYCO
MSYTEEELFDACGEPADLFLDKYLESKAEQFGEEKSHEIRAKVQELARAIDGVPYPEGPSTRESYKAHIRDAMRARYPEFSDPFIQMLGVWALIRLG